MKSAWRESNREFIQRVWLFMAYYSLYVRGTWFDCWKRQAFFIPWTHPQRLVGPVRPDFFALRIRSCLCRGTGVSRPECEADYSFPYRAVCWTTRNFLPVPCVTHLILAFQVFDKDTAWNSCAPLWADGITFVYSAEKEFSECIL